MPAKRKKIPRLEGTEEFPFFRKPIELLCEKHGCGYELDSSITLESLDVEARAKIVTSADITNIIRVLVKSGLDVMDTTSRKSSTNYDSSEKEQAASNQHSMDGDEKGLTIENQLILRLDLTIELIHRIRVILTSKNHHNLMKFFGVISCFESASGDKFLVPHYSKEELIESRGALVDMFFLNTNTFGMDNFEMVETYQEFLLALPFLGMREYFNDSVSKPEKLLKMAYLECYGEDAPDGFFQPNLTKLGERLYDRLKG